MCGEGRAPFQPGGRTPRGSKLVVLLAYWSGGLVAWWPFNTPKKKERKKERKIEKPTISPVLANYVCRNWY